MTKYIRILGNATIALYFGIRAYSVYEDYKRNKDLKRSILVNTAGAIASYRLAGFVFTRVGTYIAGTALVSGAVVSGPFVLLAIVVGVGITYEGSQLITAASEGGIGKFYDRALKILKTFSEKDNKE